MFNVSPEELFYRQDNSPAVIPGRRISGFFGRKDPVKSGELSVEEAKKVVSVLPNILASTVLPLEGQSAREINLYQRAGALAEWLGGMTTCEAAEMAAMGKTEFSDWVHHQARNLIGTSMAYDALVDASKEL
jgi:hypothetical protein